MKKIKNNKNLLCYLTKEEFFKEMESYIEGLSLNSEFEYFSILCVDSELENIIYCLEDMYGEPVSLDNIYELIVDHSLYIYYREDIKQYILVSK